MDMDQWARVRRKILMEGRSKRSVMREENLHWETLQKMLAHSRPPGYRRVKRPERKIDAHRDFQTPQPVGQRLKPFLNRFQGNGIGKSNMSRAPETRSRKRRR